MSRHTQNEVEQQLAIRSVDGLCDTELAAVALGVPLAAAADWLGRRGAITPVSLRRRIDRRWQAWCVLARRLERVAVPTSVSSALEAATILRSRLAFIDHEELHVLGLDSRNRVITCTSVARGGANQVAITARDVFRPLVAAGAARAIVAHNHPSGDPSPSDSDRELTIRLGIAGDLLGIALLDHLIIAADGHFSFAESDLLGIKPRIRKR